MQSEIKDEDGLFSVVKTMIKLECTDTLHEKNAENCSLSATSWF